MNTNRFAPAFVATLLLAGCSHADFDPPIASATATATPLGTTSPTATASATPSPSATATAAAPAACATAAPNALYIAMGSYIESSTTPGAYGYVYGYSLVDSAGNYPLVSAPLELRPGDVVQFANVDPPTASQTNGTSHSAAGLQSATFPSPFAFPASAGAASGSALTDASTWSTGRIAAAATATCYSQTLVVPSAGTFAFGDIDFYGATNMRDVIVVSSGAAQ